MPTVNNHDFRESLSWAGSTKDSFVTKCNNSDFGFNGLTSLRSNQTVIAEEHDYAAPLRFVSGNSYYGFHPLVAAPTNSSDLSMDTSENWSPTDGCMTSSTFSRGRKRNIESDQEYMHQNETAKKARQDRVEESPTVPEVQDFGLPTPSFGAQTQNYPQNFDLSRHEVPTSSSVLMDTVSHRPRYKFDAGIKGENKNAEQVSPRLVEEYEYDMAILESLLKHTHGCDIYNYQLNDL